MASTVANTAPSSPLIHRETPKPSMAKAKIADRTFSENREELGRILRRTSEIAGLNRDQTADQLKVNASSVSRWWAGSPDEPPQIWRYTSHPTLKIAFLVAQAEAHQGGHSIVVETVVRVMRTA